MRDDDFPAEERWWEPETRDSHRDEEHQICPHCRNELGREVVKVCPGCGVIFHTPCYADTEGGRAYATEGCEACRHRTYWR